MTLIERSPDQVAFDSDLGGVHFQAGQDRGDWRLVQIDWPHAIFAISAAAREGAPSEYFLRFDVTGYPHGPTACPWDLEQGTVLVAEHRPKGERAGWAFRADWNSGTALYVPWDRVAVDGHPDWPARHSGDLWDSAVGIASYLSKVHELLNAEDYLGV